MPFRIFDADSDGFVSKKEFKWMTANKRVSQRKVDVMFQVEMSMQIFCICFIFHFSAVILMETAS